jgi:hypothetical protein
MKTLSLAAAIAVAAALNLPPASATEPKAFGNDTVPSVQTIVSMPYGAAARTPHYEWQYHYVGRHARLEGHWVWVVIPTNRQPARKPPACPVDRGWAGAL